MAKAPWHKTNVRRPIPKFQGGARSGRSEAYSRLVCLDRDTRVVRQRHEDIRQTIGQSHWDADICALAHLV